MSVRTWSSTFVSCVSWPSLRFMRPIRSLYDISFYTTKGYQGPPDAEIKAEIENGGRKVRSIARYPNDVFPAFNIVLEPASATVEPGPPIAFQNHLLFPHEWPKPAISQKIRGAFGIRSEHGP